MVIETASQIEQSIAKYLKAVDAKFSLAKAYLFGSYANGTANEDSDIDIALVSNAFSGNSFTDNVNVGVLTWGINTKIEAVAFRPEDFNENNILAAEILANGKILEIR
ncbi:MAG: nucleotidyltransferase domain-containing protein [Ignavibacteriales bacterium]|nr:nucleotidyltransferase domain-containing protein [Ignavibacteriales bacterium]